MARATARDGDARSRCLCVAAHPLGPPAREGGPRRSQRVRLAAGWPCGRYHGVCNRHDHLRHVCLHPGDLAAVHHDRSFGACCAARAAANRMNAAAVVHVARTPEEVEGLRPLWDDLEPTNPEADIDFFSTVVANSPEVIRPHSWPSSGRAEARPPRRRPTRGAGARGQARLPGRCAPEPARPVGRLRGHRGRGETREDLQALLDELGRALGQGEADVLCFSKLRTGSELFELATHGTPWFCREHPLRHSAAHGGRRPRQPGDLPRSALAKHQGQRQALRPPAREGARRADRDP